MVQDNATEVTAAGIARLAGVGRAAVSNWRRRHADFPKPVGGTETSPSFALAEVESWLRHQGKLAEFPLRERVWQQLAGHPEGPVTALTQAGCVLLLIHDRPTVWLEVSAGSDERLAAMLPGALEQVLVPRFGALRRGRGGVGGGRSVHAGQGVNPSHSVNSPGAVNTSGGANGVAGVNIPGSGSGSGNGPAGVNTSAIGNGPAGVNTAGDLTPGGSAPAAPAAPALQAPTGPALLPSAPLLRGAAELAAELGARQTFEFLLGRHLDANPRQYTLTPAGLAELMAELAGPARTVLDPACGTGALLRAVTPRPGQELYAPGQRPRPRRAHRAPARPARRGAACAPPPATPCAPTPSPGCAADAVLCHPPFNERNWGHDELAYDPRWEYGFPARTESELAWVQHALAHLARRRHRRPPDAARRRLPPLRPPDPRRPAAPRRAARRHRAAGRGRTAVQHPAAPVGAAQARRRRPPQPEVLLVDAAAARDRGGGTGRDWRAVRGRPYSTPGGPSTGPARLDERPGLGPRRARASNSSTTTWTSPRPAICRPPTAAGGAEPN